MTRRLGAVAAGAIAALVLMVPLARAAESPVGTWDLNVEWPQGAAKVVMTVQREGDGLAVTWEGPRGTLHGKEPAFKAGVLTFALEVRSQADAVVALQYEGTVTGSKITGKLVTPANREIAASGTRRKAT
jgi:hypothetical protein